MIKGEDMDISKILEYQKKDFDKIKLERELENDKDKEQFENMVALVKQTQNRSNMLESMASDILAEFNKLKASYDENLASLNTLQKKDLSKMSEQEIDNITSLSESLNNNLSILEKKVLSCAEKINSSLSEFEQTKKKYILAREKHKLHKDNYEKKVQELQPKLDEIDKDLKSLEKGLDKSVVEKYKQKRLEKIFPILVPISNKSCGGCFTELSMAKQSNLKELKILECEHCRRFIYLD